MNFDQVDMASLLLDAKADTFFEQQILRCRRSLIAESANGLFASTE